MYKAIYFLAFILLVSCTSESRDILDSNENQGCGIPVQFTYTIDNMGDVDTRSIIDDKRLPDDASIGVYALNENCIDENQNEYVLLGNNNEEWDVTNISDNFENAEYLSKRSSAVFTPAEDIQGYYPTNVPNPSLRIYAYYPYDPRINYKGGALPDREPYLTIPERDNPFTEDEQIDYLYTGCVHSLAKYEYANLTFHHVQARLYIRLHNNKPSDVRVTTISITTTNNQSGKLNIATGVFTPNEGSSTITETVPSTSRTIPSERDRRIGDLLLFSCENGKETISTISITIDGNEKIVYSKEDTLEEKRINLVNGKQANLDIYLRD